MAEKCFLSGLDIGKGQLTKEHVVPKSRVPAYIATSPFNIQPAIKVFNNMKADMFLCEWEDKKIELCHTLNGSALALPRILAAILENNQTPEGIRIPKVLVPYCGFDIID